MNEDHDVINLLVSSLKDTDPEVRYAAAVALEKALPNIEDMYTKHLIYVHLDKEKSYFFSFGMISRGKIFPA